ncbi:general substrate transporter [Mycena amicta]|nr:general substrate transporter [Mycena amicta]
MLTEQFREIKHYRNAYLLAMSAAMGSIFYGYDIGIIGGVISLPSFKNYFGISKMSASQQANFSGNIVSVLQGGCFFGALGVGYFSNRWGRKPCMIAAGLFYIIGSSYPGCCGSWDERSSRTEFFAGLGVGMVSAVVPTYVSESTPRAIRGRCTGAVQLANNCGIMISASLHFSGTSNRQWRMPLAVQVIPGVLFVLLIPLQSESPRFLVEHGRLDEAARSLAHVACTSVDDKAVLDTVQEIKADFEGRKELGDLASRFAISETRARLPCVALSRRSVMFFQQATGTNAINYFSPQIFASLGISGTTSGLFATGVYGVVKVISVSLVLAFARCLIIGGFGQSAMMLWLAGYTGTPSLQNREVAPNHLRTGAMSIAIGVNWLFSFTVSKLTPIMLNKIHYGTYLLFGLFCFIMAIWAWVCLPETTGIALEDIGLLFEKDVILRAVQDGPGSRFCLGKRRRALPIDELRRDNSDGESDPDAKTTEKAAHEHDVI